MFNNRSYSQRSSIIFIATGVFILIAGALAMFGWFLNIENFKSIFPNYVTMKFNTAFCFVLLGAVFLLLNRFDSAIAIVLFRSLTGLLAAVAFITLGQYFFNWSAGIDQLIVMDRASAAQNLPYPGRMSPTSALCFGLMAMAFFGAVSHSRYFKSAAQYLFHTVTFISFISVIGFLYKVSYSLKYSFFSSMAINTASGFLLLSVVASNINYELGVTSLFAGKEIGNIIARKLFPRMVILLIVIGYATIWLERHNYISTEFGTIISIATFLVVGTFLIWDTLTEMNHIDRKRTAAEYETMLLNVNLEKSVLQRTIELQYSNDRFLKIFNANPTCVAMSSLETGAYTDINPAITDLLGYSRDEIIGKTSTNLGVITPEYREYMVKSIAEKGYIKREDIILTAKNGDQKHCIMSAELLETNQGKYMMSFVYDITTRKKIEDNLQEAKKSLEVLTDKLTNQNKQLLSFAHIISHNLRSPVSNLNLLVHFYQDSTTAEDKDDLWKNFETVVGHLNTSLDDLLETLKIQEDTDKEREELSFEKTFTPIKDMLIGQIMESGAVIKTDFSKAPHVIYPKMYLESIMLNLISNAIKYRSPKRIPEIIVISDHLDGETILTVQDNGLGIDMKRHSKNLFGMRKTFHRHAEAKGLGLFITKTQIETMGGEITAESAVDEGTKFKVIFNKK